MLPCPCLYAVPDTLLLHAVPSPAGATQGELPVGQEKVPGGYPCRATLWHVVTEGTCEFRYSLQFIFVGPVYHNTLTNCAALLSPGTFSCPSGNSPCAAPSVDLTACVAVIYPTLRICGYMDAQSTSCGRKNPLPFPHSLSSEQPPCPLRKGRKSEGGNLGVYPLVRLPRRQDSASLRKRPSPVRGKERKCFHESAPILHRRNFRRLPLV